MLSELEVDRTLPAPPSVRSESLPPPVVLYHPSGIPAALRLPDDVIHLILGELVLPPHFADAHDSPSGVPCPGGAASTSAQPLPTSPVADLKRLALTHSHFLGPIRTMIYSAPNLEGTVGDQRDPCSCSSCQVGRSAHWSMAPLRKLSEALTLNPSLGAYVRHLDKFGDLTQFLSHLNISPSLVSRTILNILRKTPNLVSLDMPLVELRDQEDLIRAVTDMTALRTLTLSTGCVMTKDGTSMMHEGDLRRIASACVELEELEILTEHLGCGAADGWVEPFAFKELRVVRLVRATSLTDQHLLAMLSQSKHLTSLVIIKSAGLDGTSGVLVPGTTKRHHALTTTGIAQILERRGATLKHLTIDVTDQPPSTDSAPGTIPSIESALVKCPKLETLTLAGPGLILPSSLPHLGSPSPSKPSRSFGMPFPHPTSAPLTNLPGLSRLSRLSIGLYPATYAPLLAFLRSLPPATSSPFTSLRAVTITSPPTNCTGHDLDATANVAALQAAVVDKTIVLSFASQSWEWDAGNAWARPIGIGGGGGHGGALRANGGQGMWAAGAGFGLFRGFGGAGGGGAFPPLRRFVAARAAPAAGGGQPGVARVRRPQVRSRFFDNWGRS